MKWEIPFVCKSNDCFDPKFCMLYSSFGLYVVVTK